MANNIIKKHNFELAKNRIKSRASQVPPSVSLESFRTEGSILRFTSHNVIGKEINENLVDPLQKKLIDQNNHIRNLYNAADEVYNALDLLDKEYVSGIEGTAEAAALASDQALAASKNAQKASNQALDASSQALDASKKATTAQADIKRTIEALQTTVRILKEFKEKVTKDLSSIASFRTLLESYQHLGDVDAIWSDVEGHKTNLASFHQQVDAFIEKVNQATARIDGDIEALKQYRTLLESYQHLGDVDAIWSDIESQKTDLSGLHEKLDAFIEETHLGLERIEGLIHQLEEDNFHAHLQYNKKIKIAFWLGGSAVGFIVINYILQIIGVL